MSFLTSRTVANRIKGEILRKILGWGYQLDQMVQFNKWGHFKEDLMVAIYYRNMSTRNLNYQEKVYKKHTAYRK